MYPPARATVSRFSTARPSFADDDLFRLLEEKNVAVSASSRSDDRHVGPTSTGGEDGRLVDEVLQVGATMPGVIAATTCRRTLAEHRAQLDRLVEALLTAETLDAEEAYRAAGIAPPSTTNGQVKYEDASARSSPGRMLNLQGLHCHGFFNTRDQRPLP